MTTIREWVSIPMPKRQELRAKFEIRQTGYVQVLGNQVLSDGISENDLYKYFSLENINKVMDWEEKTQEEAFKKLINPNIKKDGKNNTKTIEQSTDKSITKEKTIGRSKTK